MSTRYAIDTQQVTRNWRLLRSWWPSTRLTLDPLQALRVAGRYAPVSVANWKLIPPIARAILERRQAQPLDFAQHRRLTILIPFRDRHAHLRQLLPRLTATLHEQGLAFRILVIEQLEEGLFNRGRLLNIGMHFAQQFTDYYCLHDVDAVPLRANYLCPSQPLRLVNTIVGDQGRTSRSDYYFSGAISILKEQAFAANGYSNEYWGWGKEDDDLFFRLLIAGYLCYYDTEGEFEDLPNPRHQQVQPRDRATRRRVGLNRQRRSRLLRGLYDPFQDGLSTVKYSVAAHQEAECYELISVRW